MSQGQAKNDSAILLARWRAFSFPGSEQTAQEIQAIRITERGEIRMSEEARWIPFEAEQVIHATHSAFCWEARLSGRMVPIVVTDAFENGHGRLVVKGAGFLPLTKVTGADADKGELQRYLASVLFCPPMLLNNSAIELASAGDSGLRICDCKDPARASVDLEIAGDGQPVVCRADRPRMVGKRAVLTPWYASASNFMEWQGLCVPYYSEAAWNFPAGKFTYFRSEILSYTAVRQASA